jgi:hypothetical protein
MHEHDERSGVLVFSIAWYRGDYASDTLVWIASSHTNRYPQFSFYRPDHKPIMNDNQGIMPATHESDGHMNQRIFCETSKGCLGQNVEADHHVKLAEVLEEENGVLDS